MKKILLIATMVVASFTAMAQEQSDSLHVDSVAVSASAKYQLKEMYASSENLELAVAVGVAKGVAYNPNQLNGRYKLYSTENIWNFLKLDTCTGRVWQVQFDINDDDRMQNLFSFSRLDFDDSWDEIDNVGRFELYPTKNIYNFLLMDKKSGRIWQIQWSLDPDNRGLIAEIK